MFVFMGGKMGQRIICYIMDESEQSAI